MNLELLPLCAKRLSRFKKDMQDAFQQGAVDEFGATEENILPESHIDRSLRSQGAIAYEAVVDREMVGGAIVVINEKTQHNHLDFLYVKNGVHSRGIGQAIWNNIEKLHPNTKIWETYTPYLAKRNIHFYINCCGFHAVEFFNKYHPDPNDLNDKNDLPDREYFEGMFRFEKMMK